MNSDLPQSQKVHLVAAGPRKCGKTAVLAVCKSALETAGYTVTHPDTGLNTESFIVTQLDNIYAERLIEWHRQEIAKLCAKLGII